MLRNSCWLHTLKYFSDKCTFLKSLYTNFHAIVFLNESSQLLPLLANYWVKKSSSQKSFLNLGEPWTTRPNNLGEAQWTLSCISGFNSLNAHIIKVSLNEFVWADHKQLVLFRNLYRRKKARYCFVIIEWE